eukprot:GGOE01056532.1.p1 GENE.GGOE01056532.1~~GGOE01056532.1.p1  ORF type:complete len:670 (+),score=102.34 GGOE01056532.1:95-2104(+)
MPSDPSPGDPMGSNSMPAWATSPGYTVPHQTRLVVDKDPEGYYACLHVAPDASPLEIRKAYHGVSQMYHPDRLFSASPEQSKLATQWMQKVNLAFFTLSDDKRRVAYTEYGARGVELLALVPSDLSSESLRDALEFEYRRQEWEKFQVDGSQAGYIEAAFDCSPLFQWCHPLLEVSDAVVPLESEVGSSSEQNADEQQMPESSTATSSVGEGCADEVDGCVDSWPVVMTRSNTFVIRPSLGAALFPGSLQTGDYFVAFRPPAPALEMQQLLAQWDRKGSSRLLCSALSMRQCFQTTISPNVRFAVEGFSEPRRSGLSLALSHLWWDRGGTTTLLGGVGSHWAKAVISHSFALTEALRASIQVKIGPDSALRWWCSFSWNVFQDCRAKVRLKLSSACPKLRLTLSGLEWRGVGLQLRTSFQPFAPGRSSAGVLLDTHVTDCVQLVSRLDCTPMTCYRYCGLRMHINDQSHLSVGMAISASNVDVIFAYQRGQQTLRCPVRLLALASCRNIAFSSFLFIGGISGSLLLIDCWRRWGWPQLRRHQQQQLAQQVQEQRVEALAQQQLLIPKAEINYRLEMEAGPTGLLILHAEYGCLGVPDYFLDVTVPLRAYVLHGELAMHCGTKSKWDGFYNPDPLGQHGRKQLSITYQHRGETSTVKFNDFAAVRLPPPA